MKQDDSSPPRFTLVFGIAAKANLHAAQCACSGRTEWWRYRAPAPTPVAAATIVEALQHPTVTRAKVAGYRVIISKCARTA